METKPEIPDFKLAKVGTDRRRKGAGLAWFGNSGGSGAALARGGAGLLGKIAILAVTGVMGLGAFSVGRGMAPEHGYKKKKTKAFNVQKYTENTANLPKDMKYASKSGLGMVAGRVDGKTAEELAAERAEAERLAREQAEAEARAAAESAAGQVAETPDVPGVDPGVMATAAAPETQKAAGMGKKYGELTKNFGGLAGGSGVTGSFSTKKFSGKEGKALAFSQRSAPTRSKMTPGKFAGRARGVAGKQLEKAAFFSRAASKAGNESSSELASQAFDGNTGAGTSIGGAGAASGNSAADAGPGDSSGAYGGSAYGNHGNEYGPCQEGQTQAQNPNCVEIPDGTGEDDPTNDIIKLLKTLLIVATIVGVIQLILSKMTAAPWIAALYAMLGDLMVALGAIICVLGIMLMGMGRKVEGTIFAAIGALMAIMAWIGNSNATQAAEGASKEAIQKVAMDNLAANVFKNAAFTAVGGGLGGGIFANDIEPRTLDEETGEWVP
jgi:hypothetical protein